MAPQTQQCRAGDTDLRMVYVRYPEGQLHLTGRVFDRLTGAPVTGLSVTAIRNQGPGTGGSGNNHEFAATHGEFELPGLQPGWWQFQVRAAGYCSRWHATREFEAGPTTIDIELDPAATVHLRLGEATGGPAAGLELRFRLGGGGHHVSPTPTPRNINGKVSTDAEGTAVIEGLPMRELEVEAWRGDARVGRFDIHPTRDEAHYTLELTASASDG